MDTRYLQEFLTLAEHLSFSEAAEQLNMTQSNLSKHLKAMEQELGEKLFDRTSRVVALSDFGEFYLPYAKRIAASLDDAEQAARIYRLERENAFRLAVVRNMEYYRADQILLEFHREHPECKVTVLELDERETNLLYEEKQINLFATYVAEGETPDFGFIPIGESYVVAVFPEEHPLSGKGVVTLDALRHEPLLLPSRSTKMSRMIHAALGIEQDARGVNVIFAGRSVACLEFVKAGMGVSLQPIELVETSPDKTILYSDIVPKITYRYGLGYRTSDKLTPGEESMVEFIRKFSME